MRAILHILTRSEDELPRELIARQRALPETKIEVVSWTAGEPDYAAALDLIFAADSIHVW